MHPFPSRGGHRPVSLSSSNPKHSVLMELKGKSLWVRPRTPRVEVASGFGIAGVGGDEDADEGDGPPWSSLDLGHVRHSLSWLLFLGDALNTIRLVSK